MAEFEHVDTGETTIAITRRGTGPPLLLLHGFPQTQRMWRPVAGELAAAFTVVTADLRGYGDSSIPASTPDHAPYTKRAMAQDMVAVMAHLGFDRFAVAGHDRGGRVAYRTALDHPDRVSALAVLDVLPIDSAWDRADDRLMLGYWPWTLLAQPEPLPERLIGGAPDAVVANALSSEWGTPADTFSADDRAAYVAALSDPRRVHAICEEYRAAAGPDREHDRADRRAGRHIQAPTLVLWSGAGPLGQWYDDGPLAIWRDLAEDVSGGPMPGGHFFVDEHPHEVARRLAGFLARAG